MRTRPATDRRLVGSLAATTTVAYGVLFYSYGVLLVPMERDLGWRRSVLTGAFSAALLVAAVLTIPVGRWLDRNSARGLLTGGAAAAAALMALWATAEHPVAFVLVWIGLGGCMSLLFYEPAFTIITKRLQRTARHRAITSITLIAGLASTIFGPLTSGLENLFGWRGAVLVLAVLLAAVAIPLLATALAPAPELGTAGHGSELDVVPRDAIASGRFWCLTGAYLLSAITTYALAVHLVPYLVGEGWHGGHAALALGGVGLLQVVGRSGFARLAMRLDAGPLGTWVLAAKAVGIAALVVTPTIGGVLVFLAVYGAANGLQTLTRAAVVADMYGVSHYGAISAVVSSVSAVGGAAAPFAMAYAIELVGSDEPVLWGLVGIAIASAVANEMAVRGSGTVAGGEGDVTLSGVEAPSTTRKERGQLWS